MGEGKIEETATKNEEEIFAALMEGILPRGWLVLVSTGTVSAAAAEDDDDDA